MSILAVHWRHLKGHVCMILFQKRPSEERVENALWKKVRKAREDQYDFSSADIGIVHIGTIWKKSKDTSRQTLPSITELHETTNPGMDSLTEAPETLLHELNSLTSEIKVPETMHHGLDQQDEDLSMNMVKCAFSKRITFCVYDVHFLTLIGSHRSYRSTRSVGSYQCQVKSNMSVTYLDSS